MFQLLMLSISLAVYVIMNVQVRREPTPKPPLVETSPNPIVKEWFDVNKFKPEHEMVFGLNYTYDCGWSVTYVYWNEIESKWFDSNGEANMQPQYWAKLPEFIYPDKTTD